jgi:hypothetical protein
MKNLSLAVVCLAALCGCASQVPLAANHPISSQKKARAVHHWDVLADDITSQTMASLKKHEIAPETPLFVALPPDNTPFAKAFRNFLITRMVNRGLPVRNASADAVELQYETQLVRHESSRYAHIPGTFSALTAGIWVIRDLATAGSSAVPGAIGLSALADYGMGHYAGGATPTEMIVTSSIVVDQKYLFRKSDIYYIEDADLGLFVEQQKKPEEPLPVRPLKTMEVTGR